MKIRYITQHGVGEWTDILTEDADVITLAFTPECDGALTLRGKLYTVKGGEVSIPTRALPDGEYRPVLEADTSRYELEGFIKQGKTVSMAKTEEATVRRLLGRCRELERSLCSATRRIGNLEAICVGHNIFSYERKEK
ncbi:MAG: hypothetical protein IJW53_00620 [Clostridia bacterium]|nr:hypothetical protein [Clostridia bacterium]